jgi:hypothetical protein
MSNFIENNNDQFTNGQVSGDLRGNSDAAESETHLDPVNAVEQCPNAAPEEFPAPLGKLLGLMITRSGAGRATVEFEASGRYAAIGIGSLTTELFSGCLSAVSISLELTETARTRR